MSIAATTGGVYGYSQTNNKAAMAVLNASLAAAIVGAATLYFENPDKEEIRLRNEVESLKSKLDEFSSPKVAYQSSATFGAKLPSKYRGLVNPGEYKVYELDTWIEDGENRLVHQDKAIELIPPTLSPGRQ